GRVVRGANEDGAAIGPQIIKAAGKGDPLGQRGEIVVVDRKRRLTPNAAAVLEGSHQFLLFAVHADHRQPLAAELLTLALQVTELTVALRALGTGKTLAINVQRIAQLLQQTANGVRTGRNAQGLHFLAD